MEEYTFRALLNGVSMPGDKDKPCKVVLETREREELARLAVEGAGYPKASAGIVLEVSIRRLQRELPGMNGARATAVKADVKLNRETGEILP